jgi:hypothetical protein
VTIPQPTGLLDAGPYSAAASCLAARYVTIVKLSVRGLEVSPAALTAVMVTV